MNVSRAHQVHGSQIVLLRPTKLVPLAKAWFVEVPVSLKDRRAAFEATTATTTTTVNERQSASPITPARKAAVATKRVNSELAKLDPKNTKVGRNANAAFPQTRGVAAKRRFFEDAQQSGGGGGGSLDLSKSISRYVL
ncbi:hypothetical protein BCR33DRAFT_718340 [Rhizoclosmatium globosum]|uniref:Uncharacterized protein n=1 Tax=Rhizoclosmatium globosum TaxID=329046 RepID=A0A1Y2C6X1_9FUNG|nr:hypothetical protein BCR33DRAFT_718340 [Rhizoclosmatium globosum]|eukprot:ORY42647.1 hypothetical protein BCR33DRAFT_718340 [Rhizoclosmatium globosum]